MSDLVRLRGMLYNNMPDQYITEDVISYLDENAFILAEAALNEATYYGKNKYLLQAEHICDEVLKDYQSRNQISDIGNFTNDKRFDEIGKLLAKCFGFKNIDINKNLAYILSPLLPLLDKSSSPTFGDIIDNGSPNAYTTVRSVLYKTIKTAGNKKTEMVKYEDGRKVIKFTEAASYTMQMGLLPELFYNHGPNSLTGAELMAIMLHEIGHNFYKPSPLRKAASLSMDVISNGVKDALAGEAVFAFVELANEHVPDVVKDVIKTVGTFPYKIFGSVYDSVGMIYAVVTGYRAAAKRLRFINKYGIGAIINWKLNNTKFIFKGVHAAIDYDDEKFADAFATAYGYGPELYSALAKIGAYRNPTIIFSGKDKKEVECIVNAAIAILDIPFLFSMWFTDPHGSNETRLTNAIEYLQECANGVTDKKLKAEYQEQIDTMIKTRNSIKATRLDYEGSISGSRLRKSASIILQDIANCSDLRELTSSLKPRVRAYANLDYSE